MSVTIKDVAREAGTSIATVSKALNDSYTISEETKQHIRQVAKKLQYQPNIRAQTLARKIGRQAVFLTYLPRDIGFQNPHMFEILAGAETALAKKEYSLTLQGCTPKNVCAVVRDIMQRKSADGLLLHASVVTNELAAMIAQEQLAHIVIGKPAFNSRLCWIDNNNQLAGEIAAQHLVKTGHTHIGLIGGKEEDKISQSRMEGALAALQHENIPSCNVTVFRGDSTAQSGAQLARKMMRDKRVSAVICVDNYLAFGCLNALKENGRQVPEEVSLIALDSYPFAEIVQPRLTTVSIDVFEMGLQAGKLLVSKIKKPNMQVQSFTTIPNLVVRESTR